MTTYNTGNPIGSTDARDRLDNSENMDILENSTTLNSHADRLGTMRKTRKGMEFEHDNQIAAHEAEHDAQIAAHEAEHDAQIAAHEIEHDNQMQSFENDFDSRLAGMAFTRVGTFTTGATLTYMRQTLLWEVSQGGDGHEYGWTGAFSKVVTAGATPATSGGIGAGAWVDRTDVTLRDEVDKIAVARSLNVTNDKVIYSSDTTTVLDDIIYIYDSISYNVFGKPSSVGIGETIISVTGNSLETTAGSYTLFGINQDSQLSGGIIYPYSVNDLIKLGAQSTVIPPGITRLRVDTGLSSNGELLYVYVDQDEFKSTTHTLTNIVYDQDLKQYNVTTNTQTYTFVVAKVHAQRTIGDIVGWGLDDSKSDNTNSYLTAIEFGAYHVSLAGTYEFSTPITSLESGVTTRGISCQTYGEFYETQNTVTFKYTGAGYFISTKDACRYIDFSFINFEGNWSNGFIDLSEFTREIRFSRVSIKKFTNPITATIAFFAHFSDVTITARGIAFDWSGSTTLIFENVGIQGDKENNIRLTTAYSLSDTHLPLGGTQINTNVKIIGGFVQYSERVGAVSGSIHLSVDSIDIEDVTQRFFTLSDLDTANIEFCDGSRIALTNNTSAGYFRLEGAWVGRNTVKIGNLDYDNLYTDPSTAFWISLGSGFTASNQSVVTVPAKTLAELNPSRVAQGVFNINGFIQQDGQKEFTADGIIIVGSGSVGFSSLLSLWRGFWYLDANGLLVTTGGNNGANFGNGLTYKVTSYDMATGEPQESRFSLRTVSGDTIFVVNRVNIGTVTGVNKIVVGVDFVNSEIDISQDPPGGYFSNKKFIITRA